MRTLSTALALSLSLAATVLVGCENGGGKADPKSAAVVNKSKLTPYFETRKNGATYVFNSVETLQKWRKDPSSVSLSAAYNDLSKDGSPVYFQNNNYATFAKLQDEYKSQNK
ncbi:MAG TPA: hypothetical protein VK324_09205 [Tepidisphaeraceae bacterium]|nr:hypothetical protein [Tepidisphaeraceae bacterium]